MQREVTIALGVPHTPWVPSRVESLSRLLDALGLNAHGAPVRRDAERVIESRIFGERAANHEWSEAMWTWGAESDASHFLTLQDDVIPAPNFWPALNAMLEAVPDQVVGLEAVHPIARPLAEDGYRWFTTSDCLVGVGYAMPRSLLVEFLAWQKSALRPGAREAITEDTLVALWCLSTGRKIWHPLPTIIDHDTSLASTYGNDAHANRRPHVRWDSYDATAIESVEWWRANIERTPHVGRFYDVTPAMAAERVYGFSSSDFTRARADTGASVKRAVGLRLRARHADRDRPKILICTPTRGAYAPQTVATLMRAAICAEYDVVDAYELSGSQARNQDVVRVRSRFVREFLETDCTHLLWVDDDVSSDDPGTLIAGMLAANRELVAAPYPSREGCHHGAIAKLPPGFPSEAVTYRYPIELLDGATGLHVEPGNICEVKGLGLGCALIRRDALERMVEHYGKEPEPPRDEHVARAEAFLAWLEMQCRELGDATPIEPLRDGLVELLAEVWRDGVKTDDLRFDDSVHGHKTPTVALFRLMLRDRALASEDLSFFARWRDMGGRVWLYVGPGSPLSHHGMHTFVGRLEALGLRRDG